MVARYLTAKHSPALPDCSSGGAAVRETLTLLDPADAARQHAADVATLERHVLDPSSDGLPLVMAALACGRFDRVQRLLREWPAGPSLPVAAAAYASWSGDLFTIAGVWATVRESLAALDCADAPTVVLAVAGLHALQRTAADLGDPQFAATLIGRERQARLRLDAMADGGAADSLAAALGLRPPPAAPVSAEPTAAALRLLRLARHDLGLEPDAPRHRLRLRPRLVGDRLAVRDIGFADGTLDLVLHRDGKLLRCRVSQQSGAIPATVILEPVLPALPSTASVDGTPADLVPRREGHDLVLPVQLVLDAERCFDIMLDEEGPP
jgi:hypothetical protein